MNRKMSVENGSCRMNRKKSGKGSCRMNRKMNVERGSCRKKRAERGHAG